MKLPATLVHLLLVCCIAAAEPLAFPGAEGFGAHVSGGRGFPVYYVTNLNDSGPGSLRAGVLQSGRMILFKISGTITLQSGLKVEGSNLTIAGESAPGDGICVRGEAVAILSTNIIVRFLRFRPGDDIATDHCALRIVDASNVIVDHCSLSWSIADDIVVRQSGEVTVQWCVISEPLNRSKHKKGPHGFAAVWGSGSSGHGASYHHNLIADANSRSPRVGGDPDALVDIRNNVIYNIGEGNAYGGQDARINYIANYFKPGPSTVHPDRIFRISSARTQIFLEGNVLEGMPRVTGDNSAGLLIDDHAKQDGAERAKLLVPLPFDAPPVTQQAAGQAYESVLAQAGCVFPKRDAVDQRVIQSVRDGTGRIIDSPKDAGGWPELKSIPAPTDTDNDGLPDAWELAHDLNPQDPTDGTHLTQDGYSQLELYLHALVANATTSSNQRAAAN